MRVLCDKCNVWYDDAARWTLCPHPLLAEMHPEFKLSDYFEADALPKEVCAQTTGVLGDFCMLGKGHRGEHNCSCGLRW